LTIFDNNEFVKARNYPSNWDFLWVRLSNERIKMRKSIQ